MVAKERFLHPADLEEPRNFQEFTPAQLANLTKFTLEPEGGNNQWIFRNEDYDDRDEKLYILEILRSRIESHVSVSVRNEQGIFAQVVNDVRTFSVGRVVTGKDQIPVVRFFALGERYIDVRNDGQINGPDFSYIPLKEV